MLNKIKNYLPHKIEDELHYGNSKGSFNFLRQLSWNICHPYRLINRVRWINFLKTNNRRKIEFKKELETNKFQNFEKYSNELLEEKFNFYVDNGGVILDEFFSQELIDQFHHDYRLIIEGSYEKIITWLRRNVHNYGRSLNSMQLVKEVSKNELSPDFFIQYLQKKINDLN